MKYSKKHLALSLLLPIQIVLVNYMSNYQSFIESYYALGIYPYLSKLLRLLFGWIPFSIGDVLIFVLFFLILRTFYAIIKTRGKLLIPQLIQITSFLSILYFCFYFFWGLNYFRKPLEHQLEFPTSSYSTEQLTATTEAIARQANKFHKQIVANDSLMVNIPYTRKEMYLVAEKGYQSLTKDFPIFEYQFTSVKHSLMSLLQSYNGTSGYLNPWTGEAQINRRIPKTSYPTTTCHEIAHQIGYAAENEANFIGFLAANYNEDIYFKYSSYRFALGYCLAELRQRDKGLHKKVIQIINKGILIDYNNSFNFWQQYKNPFEPLVKKGYNAYLKANNQEKGIQSYNYVVDLLISYHKFKGSI